MTKELLEEKKRQLEIEKQQQFLSEKDNQEIAQKVNEYEEELISSKQSYYDANIKVIDAKVELLNELIQDAVEEELNQASTQNYNEA